MRKQRKIPIHTREEFLSFWSGLVIALGASAAFIVLNLVSWPLLTVAGIMVSLFKGLQLFAHKHHRISDASFLYDYLHHIDGWRIKNNMSAVRHVDYYKALVQKISKQLGYHEKIQLNTLVVPPHEDPNDKRLVGFLQLFQPVFSSLLTGSNAASVGKSELFLSQRLLSVLDNKREVGSVLAHEVGHCASQSALQQILIGWGPTIISVAAGLATIAPTLSTKAGLSALSIGAFGKVASFFLPFENSHSSPAVRSARLLTRFSFAASMTTIPLAMGQPEIGGLWMTCLVAKTIKNISVFANARCGEYQADRLGVMAFRCPHEAISALSKIELDYFGATEAHINTTKPQTRTQEIVGDFKELFSSHPSTHKRIARIKKTAAAHLAGCH